MNEIRTVKKQMRDEYGMLRQTLPEEQRAAFDRQICERFFSLVSYRYSDTVLSYSPIGNEIDVRPIARRAWEDRKKVAFPRCNKKESSMTYHLVSSFDELEPGAYGILEPRADLPVYDRASERAVCIVPALVFDRAGYRLGYGKGYYDRFLPAFQGTTIGFAYSRFIVERLPRGRFDLPVGLIVTEKGVRPLL